MCYAMNLPLIRCECAAKWVMLESPKNGYWAVASDILDASRPHMLLIRQPGFWQIQVRRVEIRTDLMLSCGVQRDWDTEHTLDLLSNISL